MTTTMHGKEAQISQEVLFEKLKYRPHSELQWDMHKSLHRFRVACCGRRWGKSTWAGREITKRMFIPESRHWICGPTYKLGEKEFRVVFNDFKNLGLLDKCAKSYNVAQGQMRIHFKPLDSILEVVSAEKQDSLVGEGLDSVCMSEAAKHRMSTWQMYIEPALSDKRGCADFPSTPQGFNWYKGLFDLGQLDDPRYKDYKSWVAPTWTNAAMFPGGYDDPEMVRLRENVSKMYWEQEYAAEFTSFEGMIYEEFDEKIHVQPITYNPRWRNFWGVDWGFTDPTVVLDIMVDEFDRVYVWREYYVHQKSIYDHGVVLQNRVNPDGYHINMIAADPRGPDGIATFNMLFGQVSSNDCSWQSGIEAIKRALRVRDDGRPGLFIDPSCKNLIRQMKALRAKTVKEGQNERIGQHDYDDHAPDALRYFFNEYFVMGAGRGLTDIYDQGYKDSEAAGFFTYTTGISLSDELTIPRHFGRIK